MKQRLAAILSADAAGYSRLMALDEPGTVVALDVARESFRTQIEARQGRVVDMAGDSVLALFDTAAGAVGAALAIQEEMAAAVADVPEDHRMHFRIGIHLGDVIEKPDGTVYGNGVNIAARLEGLAEPGGITVSESVRTAVKGKVAADFEDHGEQSVKNIADPVRAHALRPPGSMLRAVTGVDISRPVPGYGGRPAIAVLPFDNLSGDPEQEYFADGLAEDILTRLAMWRFLPVIARNSSFAFRGRAVDVKEVGRALGARYVLEGSVRKAGNRLRVTGQLIDATNGHHLWAERYDRELKDLFAIQDDLTDGIVGALEGAVGRAEIERAQLKPPANLNAWDSFQRGQWHHQRLTREDLAAAVPLYRRTLQLDPRLAQAHSGIAYVRLLEAWFLWAADPRAAMVEAMANARAAIAADPLDSFAHAALGMVLAVGRKHDEALAAGRRSVDLNPSNALGHSVLSITHVFRDEPDLGIKAAEASIRISPNDPIWLTTSLTGLALARHMAGDYAKAADAARLAVQCGPSFPSAWRCLANSLGQLGQLEEAREALDHVLALIPGFTTEQAARASMGFRDEAVFQRWLEGLRKAGWPG